MEQIYTIPVNEVFEKCMAQSVRENVSDCRCPFCELYNKYEADEVDLILGASMMEPDIRKKTNEKGFLPRPFRHDARVFQAPASRAHSRIPSGRGPRKGALRLVFRAEKRLR